MLAAAVEEATTETQPELAVQAAAVTGKAITPMLMQAQLTQAVEAAVQAV
jgi:hypothetical protein